MEGEKIIESLNTLWFFSNIFSTPTPQPLVCNTDGKIIPSHLQDSPKSSQHQPITPMLQTEQIQTSETKDQIQTSSETESKLKFVESITMGAPETLDILEKKEQKSRRDKRSPKSGKSRRKYKIEKQHFRDFRFDFGDIGFEGRLVPMVPRLQILGNQFLNYKMPPFRDGMAMKEHLRSWAHAVACTVR